mmetsp:Transcript_41414/g.89795  ORF Transcript_41414/g.89795 Transcript_41414/m.89795 type:complete len:241 (+) Transcript_41414:243-965(+)
MAKGSDTAALASFAASIAASKAFPKALDPADTGRSCSASGAFEIRELFEANFPRSSCRLAVAATGEVGGAGGGSSSFMAASRAARVFSDKWQPFTSVTPLLFCKSGQDMEGRKGRRCRSWGRISTASLELGGKRRPFKAKGTVVGPLTVPPKGKVPGRFFGILAGSMPRMPPTRPGKVVPMPISLLVFAKQEICRKSKMGCSRMWRAPSAMLAKVRLRLSSEQSCRLMRNPFRKMRKKPT